MSDEYGNLLDRLRENFYSDKTKAVEFRIQQLKQLQRMYRENTDVLVEAIKKDLRKPRYEALFSEVDFCANDIDYILFNIHKWVQDEPVPKNVVTLMDSPYIHRDPYGVVLVIGAWNYPLHLCMLPAAGAIAAGNCVVIKPSEVSRHTAEALAQLVPRYLDQDCYAIVQGGKEETTRLLTHKFDYIFYTGSSTVGRIVRGAANQFLTPVTLELGGKSPAYLDPSVNLDLAVRRIMWGKCCNLGQTCIAPDYMMTGMEMAQKFIAHTKVVLKEWYGPQPQKSQDIGRIINEQHFSRVLNLIQKAGDKVVLGGGHDKEDLWIEPSIVLNATREDAIMQEEIFGPVLPIVIIENHEDAIRFIRAGDKPLACYVFSENTQVVDDFVNKTSSGGMCINDVVFQLGVDELPFGGVGNSGMGAYHGRYSFETFSHQKAVLGRSFNAIGEKLASIRYPPYSKSTEKWGKIIMKKRNISFSLKNLPMWFVFVSGMMFLSVVQWGMKVLTAGKFRKS